MLNFLDLSAASEDERRRIKEILSDTSIVDIASPQFLTTSSSSPPLPPPSLSSNPTELQNNSKTTNAVNFRKTTTLNNSASADCNNIKNINSSIAAPSPATPAPPTLYSAASSNLNKISANATTNTTPTSNASATTTTKLTTNNIAHQQQYQNTNSISHGTSGSSQQHYAKQQQHITTNNHYQPSSHLNNIHHHHQQQPPPQQPQHHLHQSQPQHMQQQQQQHLDSHPKNNNNVNNNNLMTPTYHGPPPPPTSYASPTNLTQQPHQPLHRQTTIPRPPAIPQTAAQMPPQMAGDMNRVIGMDMSRPQGYPLPPYGAPPPPTSHVYGSPPIFQHYPPHHYLIHYANIPQYMHYMMPPPPANPMVPPRLVPPQPNQSPSSPNNLTSTTSENSRHQTQQVASSITTSETRNLEPSIENVSNNQPMQSPSDKLINDTNLICNSVEEKGVKSSFEPDKSSNIIDKQTNTITKISNQATFDDKSVDDDKGTAKDTKPQIEHDACELLHKPKINNATTKQVLNNISKIGNQAKSKNGSLSNHNESIEYTEQKQEIESANRPNSEDQVKSSDEGFDTQSSLDMSKQSQENSIQISDNTKSPPSNNPTTNEKLNDEQHKQIHKSTDENAQKLSGPWGSASSKSWADLFKKRGIATNESTSDNDHEHNYDSDNSGEDVKISGLDKSNATVMISSLTSNQKETRSQERSRRALDKMAPRLALKINTITLKHSLPFLKPRGFINKGNGCYINATLQALIACPPFYNLMKEIGDLRCTKRDNSFTPIIDSFAELFLNFPPLDTNKKNKQQGTSSTDQKMTINNLQAESIEPKCIYNVLGQIKSECLKGAQEDAEEFLSCVLNGIHEEMIGLCESSQTSNDSNGDRDVDESIDNDVSSDANLWREVGAKNRSLPIRTAKVINTPIQEIFGGSLFSIRTAGKDRCGHLSPFFDLQLDISSDNVKSVQDAIKSFTAPEIINDFYCSKTKQKLDAQRRTFLAQLPPILILHLKQFVYTQDHGLRKLMKKIEYPIDFEIPEGCVHEKSSASDKHLRTSRSYKLLAVVYHDGKEAIKGHYLTDVYHIGSSQWIRCDDSTLKVVPSPRIENSDSCSRTPYLLFYRRLNTLRAQTTNHENSNLKKKNS